MGVTLGIVELNIDDIAVGILHGFHPRIDKSLVWSQVEFSVSCQHLLVKHRIDLHGIAFHQGLASLVVALALDALNFSEQLSEQLILTYVLPFRLTSSTTFFPCSKHQ